MIKKCKILLFAMVLVLAFGQVAFAALNAVGPVRPDIDPGPGWSPFYNGFPLWYRDSLGQTVALTVPPNPLSIPDPVIPGNAFSAQVGFGSEAMYWHSTATMPVPGGDALCVLALEAAFAGGDAADGDQIVFQRIRLRIDVAVAGDYIVTTPYSTRTFTNVPVGNRAINETIDIGAAPGAPEQALKGDVGPFLKQVGAAAGTLGDAATPAPVTNGPNGNIFRVQGPGGLDVSTPLFVTGARLYTETPFTITRSTFSRGAAGTFADVWANIPLPITPGVALTASVPGGTPVPLTQQLQEFFARVPITGAFTPNVTQVTVNGNINGFFPGLLRSTLKDQVSVRVANYSVANQTLAIAAVSTDATATLRAFNFVGATAAGKALRVGGAVTTFTGVTIPPVSVLVKSSSGGEATFNTVIIP